MPEEVESTSWRKLAYDFTQDTTFHGVRYITRPTKYNCRKVFWFLLVATATSVLIMLLKDRFEFLREYPLSVKVEVKFDSSVQYPAVTLCNQNFFRRSAAHKYGLLDIIEDGYSSKRENASDDGDRREENIDNGFLRERDMALVGAVDEVVYRKVSARVCKLTCIKVNNDRCCAVVFQQPAQLCVVTALQPGLSGVQRERKKDSDLYLRKKCKVNYEARCTFDEQGCQENDITSFAIDSAPTVRWEIVNYKSSTKDDESPLPPRDHTLRKTTGNYLSATTKFRRKQGLARFKSVYLQLNSSCLTFFHQIRMGSLRVKYGLQESEMKTIWQQSNAVGRAAGHPSHEWELTRIALPDGYFKVSIEAFTSAIVRLNVAIDDVIISQCRPADQCRHTRAGSGYDGSVNKTQLISSGAPCQPWNSIPNVDYVSTWDFHDSSAYGAVAFDRHEAFCRNPTHDVEGPWCIVDSSTYTYNYCNVPYCECRVAEHVEFACASSGRCISQEQFCDGVIDCDDASDERHPNCTSYQPNIACDFEFRQNCSFQNQDYAGRRWSLYSTSIDPNDNVTMKFPSNNQKTMLPGDLAVLSSPTVIIHTNSCLQFSTLIRNAMLEVLLKKENSTEQAKLLCSIAEQKEPNRWYVKQLELPSGAYSVDFVAVVRQSEAEVYLDNLTMVPRNCTFFDWEPPPNPTDEPGNDTGTGNTTMLGHLEEETTTGLYEQTTLSREEMEGNETEEQAQPSCEIDCSSCEKRADGSTWEVETPENFTEVYKDCSSIRKSLHCEFGSDCACGYTYSASNEYFRFVTMPAANVIGNMTANASSTVKFLSLQFVVIQPKFKFNNEWAELRSPAVPVDRESCAIVTYVAPFLDLQVFRQDEISRTLLAEVTADQQQAVFNQLHLNLKSGFFSLQFHFRRSSIIQSNNFGPAGLRSIQLEERACSSINAELAVANSNNVSCSFENHVCGWRDLAVDGGAPPEFFRSISGNIANGERIGYYVRTRRDIDYPGYGIRGLQSPIFHVKLGSQPAYCVKFRTFGQGSGEETKTNAMQLKLHSDLTDKEGMPVHSWRIHNLLDSNWINGQFEINQTGLFSLTFYINGPLYRGGLDNVLVLPRPCGNISLECEGTAIACSSADACVQPLEPCESSSKAKCPEQEDVPVCPTLVSPELEADNKNDEINEEIESPPVQPPEESDEEQTVHEVPDLDGMYRLVGHQSEDFFYSCKWLNSNCNSTWFYTQITDFGLCYTFNRKPDDILSIAQTGSSFGLTMQINIEQYEYMLGPNSDAGIKVFLHHQNELPQVRDLGFAISPGLHALTGITSSYAKNQPPPWGDCGDKQLSFYSNYTFSRCQWDCETNQTKNKCNCRDGYMPEIYNKSGEIYKVPLCSLDQYFQCLNGFDFEACTNCKQPCEHTVFEPALSYAKLSKLSVDKILNTERQALTKKYTDSLNLRQRVDGLLYVNDMAAFMRVSRSYEDLRGSIKENLDDENFAGLLFTYQKSAETFKNRIFSRDMVNMFGFLDDYRKAWEIMFRRPVDMFNKYSDEIGNITSELEHLIQLSNFVGKPNPALKSVSTSAESLTILLNETLTLLINLEKNFKIQGSQGGLFGLNVQECHDKISKLKQENLNLQGHTKALGESNLQQLQQLSGVIATSREEMRALSGEVHNCYTRYPTIIHTISKWKTETENMDDNNNLPFSYGPNMRQLTQNIKTFNDAVRDYRDGKLEKGEFFNQVIGEHRSTIQSLVDRVKASATSLLSNNLEKMKLNFQESYFQAMLYAEELEHYVGLQILRQKSDFVQLFKGVKPNYDDTSDVKYDGRELVEIWPRGTSFSTFIQQYKAKKKINELVAGFFDHLTGPVADFENSMTRSRDDLTKELDNIKKERDDFLEAQKINPQFISDNFMQVDVFYKQLKKQAIEQIKQYTELNFFAEIGGYIGLLIGGSALTIVELLDFLFYNGLRQVMGWKTPSDKDQKKTEGNDLELTAASPQIEKQRETQFNRNI